MGKYVSRRAAVGFGRETTRGTAITPNFWLPWSALSFDSKELTEQAAGAHGNIQLNTDAYMVKVHGSGDLTAQVDDKMMGLLLTATLGGLPVTTGAINFTHTWTGLPNNNQHQSLSILIQDPNFTQMFPLSMIDKFAFKVDPNKIVETTLSLVSRGSRDWTTQTPAYTNLGIRYLQQHLRVYIANPSTTVNLTAAALAAAPKVNVRNLSFAIDKNVMELDDVGTLQAGDINNQAMSISGTIEATLEDSTFHDYDLLNSYKAMRLAFVYGTNNSLQIDLQRVRFSKWEPNKALDAIAMQKIDFTALYDPTNGIDAIGQCILKNQQSTYV